MGIYILMSSSDSTHAKPKAHIYSIVKQSILKSFWEMTGMYKKKYNSKSVLVSWIKMLQDKHNFFTAVIFGSEGGFGLLYSFVLLLF